MGKTKTIIFIEPIQLTQFFMPKIGVEKVVNDGEDYLEVFKEARKEIEAMARQAYPQHFAFTQQQEPMYLVPNGMGEKIEIPIIPSKKKEPESEDNFSLLDKINNSKNVKELKSWELLIKVEKDKDKQFALKHSYKAKMEELTQKEAV